MLKHEDLIKTKEYWMAKIQSDLFAKLEDYMLVNSLSRTAFAEELGVSKGYVTQILNGDFDHKLSKLIELSLAIGKAPNLNFADMDAYISSEMVRLESISNETSFLKVVALYGDTVSEVENEEKVKVADRYGW